MRYEKITAFYKKINSHIKIKNYKKALKRLALCSKATNFYNNLPYDKENIIKLNRKLIKKTPQSMKSSKFYYYVGIIYFFIGELEKSKMFLTKAVKINKKRPKYHISLALLYERLQKHNAMVKSLEKAESLDQFNLELLLIKGRILELDGQRDKALDYYNTAIDSHHDKAQPYFMKGRCLFLEDKFKESVTILNEALKRINEDDFAYVDLLTLLAEIYFDMQNYKKSLELFDELEEKFPYRTEHYYAKSEVLFSIGKESKALNVIDKAIELAPNIESKVASYFRKAIFLNMLSRTDEAMHYLEEILKISPNDLRTLDMYGEILSSRSEYEKSIEVYKKRNEIEEFPYTYYYIADSYFALGIYYEAYKYINKFISSIKDYPQAYILRAKINAVQGYKLLSIRDLNKALELDEDLIFLYETDLFYLSSLEGMKEFETFLQAIENRNE